MMRSRATLVQFLVLAMMAAGCGSGEEASPTTQVPGPPADNGGGGDGVAPAVGDLPTSVPDDFPIPLPTGWEIDVNAEIGLTASATSLLYSADEFDNLVTFYDEWTRTDSAEFSRTEAAGNVIFTRLEPPIYLITITRDHEERDQTWTLLNASGSAGDE